MRRTGEGKRGGRLVGWMRECLGYGVIVERLGFFHDAG